MSCIIAVYHTQYPQPGRERESCPMSCFQQFRDIKLVTIIEQWSQMVDEIKYAYVSKCVCIHPQGSKFSKLLDYCFLNNFIKYRICIGIFDFIFWFCNLTISSQEPTLYMCRWKLRTWSIKASDVPTIVRKKALGFVPMSNLHVKGYAYMCITFFDSMTS